MATKLSAELPGEKIASRELRKYNRTDGQSANGNFPLALGEQRCLVGDI